jgi:signal transduction histidine kinase
MWQFTPVAALYAASALVLLVLAYRSWQMRPARGASYLAALALSTAIWTIGYLLGFFNTNLDWKLVFLRVEYLGIFGTTYFFVLFVLTYAHYERWVNRYTLTALAIVPAISLVLVLTVTQHDWFYRTYGLAPYGDFLLFDKTYGPIFWLNSGYSYLVVFMAALILIQAMLRYASLYRNQIALLIPAVIIPIIPNSLYIVGHNPFYPYDVSSLSFGISALLVFLSIRYYRLLSIIPVAHDLVFKHVSSGVIVIDTQMNIIDVNPVALGILNQPYHTLVGQPILKIMPHYSAFLPCTTPTETETSLGGNHYDLHIAPLRDRGGRHSGCVIILHDITQRKQLIEDLDAYAHTVAHDLKNPLGLVMNYAELLKMRFDDLPETTVRRHLDMVVKGSDTMLNIINELLLLASVHQLENLTIEPLDMDDVVRHVVTRLHLMVEQNQAEIIFHEAEAWPEAVGYAAWVEEVWANYISNAIKYGGQPPRVELGAESESNGMVRFWVKDNGQGLDADQQARLFSQFTRLGDRTVSGHGLGLSIVRRIVDKLGGQVSVESAVGQGSTFSFSLPAVASPADNGLSQPVDHSAAQVVESV